MDEVLAVEERKYQRMWGMPSYRTYSPGERALPAIFDRLKHDPGATVADFGCGTGRAAAAIQARGFDVTGIDFASNCLDVSVDIPFIKACLWSLPGDLIFDYGVCTDVMEHLPPAKVPAALRGIADSCRVGCFFQIATFKDRFGEKIGEPLHLSVQPARVWEQALMRHWPHVETLNEGRNARFWVTH